MWKECLKKGCPKNIGWRNVWNKETDPKCWRRFKENACYQVVRECDGQRWVEANYKEY